MQSAANCLIQELSRFKQSSKEAVENTETFNQFKQYMHIERPFEKKLKLILEEVNQQHTPHLVLVCGSVGDGKSHLISYLKKVVPQLFENLTIYNDATESFSPTKTSVDTLREILYHFSDEAMSIGGSLDTKHIIIAINLGTLNNFLNSEYGNEFTTLKQFVEENKILDDERTNYKEQHHSKLPFRFINISDYHLYELGEGHVKSLLLEQVFDKITQSKPENPFYRAYQQQCNMGCSYRDTCPVVKNYELLMEDKVQRVIIDLLAELTLKNKLIISPRMFLDFIYKILVPEYYSGIQDIQNESASDTNLRKKQYVKGLLPNLLYQLADKYESFRYLKELEPNVDRDQEMDEFIVSFFVTDNTAKMIHKIFPKDEFSRLGFIEILQEVGESRESRMLVLKTMLRLKHFFEESIENSKEENVFRIYLKYLYFWNKNDYQKLRDLYKDVMFCTYNWNGKAEQEQINVFIGKNQSKYKLSQKLSIEHSIDGKEKISDKVLTKFSNHMVLKFKEKNSSLEHVINIDYNLFELLIRMKQGYRPNSQDKSNFINFVDFVEKITVVNTDQNSIEIKEKKGKQEKKYILTYDKYFGFEFKEK